MTSATEIFDAFDEENDIRKFTEHLSFREYLSRVRENPLIARNSWQRMYDMIESFGTRKVVKASREYVRYKFFDGEFPGNDEQIFGLEESLSKLVNVLKSGALGMGPEKRIILLHGPVGSAKSTIARMLKRGLEYYTRTDEGAFYTFEWLVDPDNNVWERSPMNDEPLKLIPAEIRDNFIATFFDGVETKYPIKIEGDLNPSCRFNYKAFCNEFRGDWKRVLNERVRVTRLIASEKDRIAIGTFQPKDEKNQDSTELTGDVNYRKIAIYGSDSDPRCLVGNSIIATSSGIVKIEDFAPDNPGEDVFTPLHLGVSSLPERPVSIACNFYEAGRKDVVKVKTRLGYEIGGTPNHKLLSISSGERQWKELRDIEVGDYVALFRKSHIFSEENAIIPSIDHKFYGNERNHPKFPLSVTPELAYLLGAWTGDGHISISEEDYQYEFGFTQMDNHILERIRSSFEKVHGLTLNVSATESKAYCARISSKILVRWYKECVGVEEGAHNKKIPDCIMRSTKECILAFINGLWDTDGTIRHNDTNFASYSTVSNTLASQLHTLLLSIGVVASKQWNNNNIWDIDVFGAEVNNLLTLIPEIEEKISSGEIKKLVPSPNVDIVPNIKVVMQSLYKRAVNRDALKRRFAGTLFDKNKPNAAYKTVRDFMGLVEIREDDKEGQEQLGLLASIASENYLWLKVEEKTECPQELCYDISVKDTHAYWANGFVSHNCFNFDGEFNVANRGFCEFIEVLKLDVAFLYDLLGATQEHKIKPKKFAQTDIDEVVLGHTNSPEFTRLLNNQLMEAFRDRTVKIDIPYLVNLDDEMKVYERDFNNNKPGGKFIAPHTIAVASMWSILTRLEDPKNQKLSLMQKLKLYNGKTLPGFTSDNVRELQEDVDREGLHGISPRYIQDKLSNSIVAYHDATSINPFMVMNQLEEGLKHHTLISDPSALERYKQQLSVVKEEYEDIIKNEVQRAISADEDAIARLCSNYIDNVKAYTQKEKVKNPYTGKEELPDERLMRSIEEKIDIPDSRKEDFRREIMNYIGALAIDGKQFKYFTNERLQKALELKLFEDQKDTIKLKTLVSQVIDKDTQEKIDIVKTRLVKNYGYDEASATDVLNYVASIFARGDAKS